MNKNYKSCENGHFFASSFESCPHCKNQTENPTGQSSIGQGNLDSDKTSLIGNMGNPTGNASGNDKTIGNVTQRVGSEGAYTSDDGDRTRVVTSPGNISKEPKISATRKLVGWLVSYSLSEFGVDFKLYEGQNIIGRDQNCTIRITEDPSISSKHATILFRGNQFYLRDEMSTNPSFVNKEEVMPGNTIKLNDGDTIKVGGTDLLIRYALLKTE
jgi:hypothetical protein